MGKLFTPKRRKINQVPILIVENNADHWLIMRSALAQCFPEVKPVWANNAAQISTYLENASLDKRKLPRLVLLELYLPCREEGMALLKFIKTHLVYRYIPVIVLSHSREQIDVTDSYTFGSASYIVKPITYHQWLHCFYVFRRYWWESVTSPLNS